MADTVRRIGVMGGTYNPVHIGHRMLASYMVEFGGMDEVWMCLSPANPLKLPTAATVSDCQRMDMLRLACEGLESVRACDIELTMPIPSYTVDTLCELERRYSENEFHLIIGADNWQIFRRWRRWEEILERFAPVVYPRPGYGVEVDGLPEGVCLVKAPVLEISSTFIREGIAAGRDMSAFLPHGVDEYIKSNGLYV